MPVCPECSFWTPNFTDGDVDHAGTYVSLCALIRCYRWFCNGCWRAWEDERKEKRITTGKLLPEDREVSYADIRSPIEDNDYDNPLGFKLSLLERYESDADWFHADVNSLTIETRCRISQDPSSSSFLNSIEEKAKVVEPLKASWFKTLDWLPARDDEFSFDFTSAKLVIGSPGFQIKRLSQIPWVYFPQHIKTNMFRRFRLLAREARKHRKNLREVEERKEREREELRRKQQVEIQQKQKDLLQLAIKRAQNAQQTKKVVVATSSPQPPKVSNVWSSAKATAVQPPPPTTASSSWSSAAARPMMPPAVPVAWPAMPSPTPIALQTHILNDPWSVWSARPVEPQAKRPRQPPDANEKS
jgi:hypothetical protein